jgi:hypothetical protein
MYDAYVNYIKSFISLDRSLWSFKQEPAYREILEHVFENQGLEYFAEIKKFDLYNQHKDYLIDLCHTNDSCGMPIKFVYEDFTTCSSTNLRYILHSILILSYMNECNLNNIDVIEIGGGYGGLCYFIYKLSNFFNIKINTYTIFDLPEPLQLQAKYLDGLNINNVNFYDLNNFGTLNKNSFLVSNYAFSEIALPLKHEYTNKVLNTYVSHGFLTWNWDVFYDFIENKQITKEVEVPQTGGGVNSYVRFKPFD